MRFLTPPFGASRHCWVPLYSVGKNGVVQEADDRDDGVGEVYVGVQFSPADAKGAQGSADGVAAVSASASGAPPQSRRVATTPGAAGALGASRRSLSSGRPMAAREGTLRNHVVGTSPVRDPAAPAFRVSPSPPRAQQQLAQRSPGSGLGLRQPPSPLRPESPGASFGASFGATPDDAPDSPSWRGVEPMYRRGHRLMAMTRAPDGGWVPSAAYAYVDVAERKDPFAMRFLVRVRQPALAAARVVSAATLQWMMQLDRRTGGATASGRTPSKRDPDARSAEKAMRRFIKGGKSPKPVHVILWVLQRVVLEHDPLADPPLTRLALCGENSPSATASSVGGRGTGTPLTHTSAAQLGDRASAATGGHMATLRSMRRSESEAAPPGRRHSVDLDAARQLGEQIARGRIVASHGLSTPEPTARDAAMMFVSGSAVQDAGVRLPLSASMPALHRGSDFAAALDAADGGSFGADDSADGDREALEGSSLVWERYCRESTVVRRMGAWEQRQHSTSGDLFYWNPVTRQGTFHLADIDDPTVSSMADRIAGAGRTSTAWTGTRGTLSSRTGVRAGSGFAGAPPIASAGQPKARPMSASLPRRRQTPAFAPAPAPTPAPAPAPTPTDVAWKRAADSFVATRRTKPALDADHRRRVRSQQALQRMQDARTQARQAMDDAFHSRREHAAAAMTQQALGLLEQQEKAARVKEAREAKRVTTAKYPFKPAMPPRAGTRDGRRVTGPVLGPGPLPAAPPEPAPPSPLYMWDSRGRKVLREDPDPELDLEDDLGATGVGAGAGAGAGAATAPLGLNGLPAAPPTAEDRERIIMKVLRRVRALARTKKGAMRIQNAFRRFDKDRSRTLNVYEFHDALRALGADVDEYHTQIVLDAFDGSGDGLIDYGEFMYVFVDRRSVVNKWLEAGKAEPSVGSAMRAARLRASLLSRSRRPARHDGMVPRKIAEAVLLDEGLFPSTGFPMSAVLDHVEAMVARPQRGVRPVAHMVNVDDLVTVLTSTNPDVDAARFGQRVV